MKDFEKEAEEAWRGCQFQSSIDTHQIRIISEALQRAFEQGRRAGMGYARNLCTKGTLSVARIDAAIRAAAKTTEEEK